jgi:hypothetical protein
MLVSVLFLGLVSNPANDGLAAPFRVRDAAGLIDVDVGHAAPLMADFDGDGIPDLLVGQFGQSDQGKLRIYKNIGTTKEPKFEGFTWFKTGEEEARIPSG